MFRCRSLNQFLDSHRRLAGLGIDCPATRPKSSDPAQVLAGADASGCGDFGRKHGLKADSIARCGGFDSNFLEEDIAPPAALGCCMPKADGDRERIEDGCFTASIIAREKRELGVEIKGLIFESFKILDGELSDSHGDVA